ncbi:hypothetical protein B484DRAFT_472781, partial [Ochromonadaceae sp. CCMP2298]
ALFCGKDNNQNAKLFLGDFFVWAETLRKTGYWYRGVHYTIDLLIPADLKAGWQATGRGGGSASTNEFCFLCTETRGEKGSLHLACDDCRTRHGREQCRHRPFIISRDELEGQDIQGVQVFCPWSIPTLPRPLKAGHAECKAFLQSVGESTTGDKVKLQRETKRWLEEKLVVAVGDEGAPNHLARASRQLLETNLQLRFPTEELTALREDLVASQTRLSVDDDGHEVTETEAMRSLLAKCLKTEEVIKLYTTRVGTKSITAFIDDAGCLVMDILHCELRVGEQLLTRLVQAGQLRGDLNGEEKKELISKTETIINERIFRSQGAGVGNYKITVERGAVQTMSMNNDRLRKIFANIGLLIEANLGANGAAFAKLFSLYLRFMTRLQSDVEYSDEEIKVASDAMTDFGECWISLFGTDSITNYVHYIIAGHVASFLRKYRNLAIFANQGWEAMNGVMKKYLGRRTQNGGSKQGGCESVAEALLRYVRRLWLYYWDGTEMTTGGPLDRALAAYRKAKQSGDVVDVVELMHVALHGVEAATASPGGAEASDGGEGESGRTSQESPTTDHELVADLESLAIYQPSSTTGPAPRTDDSDFELAT